LITIILPVLQEPYLPTLLKEIEATIKEPYEVLVQTEKGLGYAVKCGLERSKGDVIVIADADGSHPIHSIPNMTAYINKFGAGYEYDIVVGSRYNGGITQDSFSRKVISRIYCKFAQLLFGLNVKDNMSGFVAVKKEVFVKYPIQNKGYKWLLELLVKSKHDNLKVVEYPIVFEQRKLGKSKANYKEAFHTLWFMLKLRYAD
jgi:dolichol-phosphate mannosyltransferase